jgi:LPXTG-motif cell wall-anchored protein
MALIAVLSGTATNAAAVGLPAGFLIGDQDGIQVNADGEYIINAVGLMPGDVLTKTITIRNLSEGMPYALTLIAEPEKPEGPVDLLEAIELTLELNGTQIYKGAVRGDDDSNMVQNALQLGTYKTGDESVLKIKLVVDELMVPSETISKADVKWIFNAAREPDPDPPKTGQTAGYVLFGMTTSGLLMISATLVFLRKRKDEQRKNEMMRLALSEMKGE